MSNFQVNITSAFRVIDRWQQVIIRNAQGLLEAGYNKTAITFGHTHGVRAGEPQDPTHGQGGRGPIFGGGDTLDVASERLVFEQGQLEPSFSPTSLGINGEGFFILAENLNRGSRLYLTRAGDFRYDAEGRLVNRDGLFVVGGRGILGDPVEPIRNPGDGTVDLTTITLAKVPSPSDLAFSGYGSTVYSPTTASGGIRAFANGRPEVGFVQTNTIETPFRPGLQAELQVDTQKATQTYKIFKDMLTEFNKTVDDSINLVR